MSVAFAALNRHILLDRAAHALATEMALGERRRILVRSATGLVPYLLATILAFVSAYVTLAICAALAIFYALPLASGASRRGVASRPWPSPPPPPSSASCARCSETTASCRARPAPTSPTPPRAATSAAAPTRSRCPPTPPQVAAVRRLVLRARRADHPARRRHRLRRRRGARSTAASCSAWSAWRGPPRFEPERWRAHVSGRRHHRRRCAARAREDGLFYAPDPGAAEQSQLGGNIATNAGGPHTFKYGVTGTWVTGLELVLAPGELVTIGGPVRKDVAGYDLKSLMVGSEGTLGIVTAAWLQAAARARGPAAGGGVLPRRRGRLRGARRRSWPPAWCRRRWSTSTRSRSPTPLGAFPGEAPPRAGVHADRRGRRLACPRPQRLRDELLEALAPEALATPRARPAAARSASCGAGGQGSRWRSSRGAAARSPRTSSCPLERLAEAIAATREIGARHGLPACSWGHAGDGNLHSTFMIDLDDPAEVQRSEQAAEDLFALAVRARRLGLRRARPRPGQARRAGAPVARAGAGAPRVDQAPCSTPRAC